MQPFLFPISLNIMYSQCHSAAEANYVKLQINWMPRNMAGCTCLASQLQLSKISHIFSSWSFFLQLLYITLFSTLPLRSSYCLPSHRSKIWSCSHQCYCTGIYIASLLQRNKLSQSALLWPCPCLYSCYIYCVYDFAVGCCYSYYSCHRPLVLGTKPKLNVLQPLLLATIQYLAQARA